MKVWKNKKTCSNGVLKLERIINRESLLEKRSRSNTGLIILLVRTTRIYLFWIISRARHSRNIKWIIATPA